MTIQYDGSGYCGWQIQLNSRTIQQTIKEAIELVTKTKVNLIGAGRTDTGVHALGQTANFIYEENLDLYKFKYQLNSILPKDISITEMSVADEKFNSRFDAVKRSYIYLFTKGKNPFLYKYAWNNKDINVKELNQLSKSLLGKKDYTSFCRKNSDTENKICNIQTIHWKELNDMFIFYIEADRFLHGMVRTIIGTLLNAQNTGMSGEDLQNIVLKQDREEAGMAVPAKGLFLYKIKY